ncbi:MAG: CHAT domain-containing protein [Cyanobacteria bacterium P01_G01_bin.67]
MKKIIQFLTISILSCTLAIVISINFIPAKATAQNPPQIRLIQEGIDLYEAEQFSQAAQAWNQALSKEEDLLSKSLILSNLSLAYQRLGRWQEAESTIDQSLKILKNLDNSTPTYAEILAKALNSQGHLQWLRGNFSNAIAAWELATTNYLQAGDTANTFKCQLNQIKALQASGLSSKATEKLEQMYQDLAHTPNQFQSTGLQYLGNALRTVGNLQKSAQVLKESLTIVPTPETLLELGNTEKALSDRYLATNQLQLAEQYTQATLYHYQQAFNQGKNLQAGLNYLSLAIALGKWSDISTLIPQIKRSLTPSPTSRTEIYARLNFARSLTCLREIQEHHNLQCVSALRREQLKPNLSLDKPKIEIADVPEIAQAIKIAIHQATDAKTKSYSIGELGRLYESQQQWQLAQQFTQQALLTLEGIQAPEIRYRWQWQLGRILKQQGDIAGAISSYAAAIDNLQLVRRDLLIVNSEVQFSFRDYTEPLYRELVDLLLKNDVPQTGSDSNILDVTQEYLFKAIQTIDTLQLSELENFLNCDLTSISSSVKFNHHHEDLEQIDSQAGFIYPIILEDRLEVIFKSPGQPLQRHTNYIQKSEIEKTLRELKTAIIRGYASEAIALSQKVYSWLIEPWEEYLEDSTQISTLVFILDGELRNIPMGVLYDSQRQEYLVQKSYALVLLPSFQAFNLQNTTTELKVLGAGISQELQVENKSFSRLDVTAELANIKHNTSSSILLNTEFTQSNIQKNLEQGDFSVVHLATHGNFSSNPEETYILIYDSDVTQGSLLKAKDLDRLLRHSGNQKPLELLVLSACETAQGDARAALGLAGLAIRAGARSTLATLWQVSDQSTVKFMERFYQELSIPGTSKAIALHRAQQALFDEPNYQAPYYWSPYVLVGNWR